MVHSLVLNPMGSAPFGSLERFVAVLIEHCAGNFPLWLAPDQIAVLPISERFNDYAAKVYEIFYQLNRRHRLLFFLRK